MSVKALDDCEMPTKSVIKATVNNPYPWPGPKDHQNITDNISLWDHVCHYKISKRQG